MEVVNLLKFLNSVTYLNALSYARCDKELVNFLDLMTEDEQFTRSIDLGLIYITQISLEEYDIVDGLSRLLSLSLLLHAICECYKKTTSQNDKAINTIRKKYLFAAKTKLKLRLPAEYAELYAKIINGERLSGREKTSPMFKLLHNFWAQIKDEKLQAANIFKMLQKINVVLVDTNDVSQRDLYYKINSEKRNINQILLIDDYMKDMRVFDRWQEIKDSYFLDDKELTRFLKDFFITKFNYKKFKPERLYESYVNYFGTMLQYIPETTIMKNMKRSAMLYSNMLNVNFKNEDIRHSLIGIKRHNGEDTYAYILNVYEDFYTGNISEAVFAEILNTIEEYLKKRELTGKNIDFNELIQYLNTLITFN